MTAAIILVAVTAIVALLVAVAALYQTEAIWRHMDLDFRANRDAEKRIFDKIDAQFSTLQREIQDLSSGVARIEGVLEK